MGGGIALTSRRSTSCNSVPRFSIVLDNAINRTKRVEEAEQEIRREVSTWSEERRVISTVVTGFAVEEIVKYAEEHSIDLIVVGTHGLTGISHLLIGSVAEKLVRAATCPVLTVRPGGHQFLIEASQETSSVGS